ncbi:hypothetical protein PHLGIDRAFT_16437 [Phlebiopsis gigantea 11061_1 CR5-6]|uniref:Uncharacterized protein n=1 Tax=Phlebiopsis gigantea (strain 11061_1 CR5-6) TaxID=745531 RepID=A0A0C3S0N1_PHLG1|nr:hypothetical protein PHLGIDRAFT_16437 [Phlebiopsis gigantea 11061_1 CR5-6]
MSTDLVPYTTAWLSDSRVFHEKLETMHKLPPPSNPFQLITVQVGKPCLVRGPPTPSGYDRWYSGTVREISMAYTFLDGSQSDRFVVEFTDPARPELAPQTGVFFKRWHEVCGVGEARLMPRITDQVVVDMLYTRVVYTPFIAQSLPARGGGAPWVGPVWTAGLVENHHTTADGTTTVDLKFAHFMGGLCARAPTRVAQFRSLEWVRRAGVPTHQRTMHRALCGERRVGSADDASVRSTMRDSGNFYFNPNAFRRGAFGLLARLRFAGDGFGRSVVSGHATRGVVTRTACAAVRAVRRHGTPLPPDHTLARGGLSPRSL